MTINIQTLKDMYGISAPSYAETKMGAYIQDRLRQLGVKHDVTQAGQVYHFKKGTPLLSAHMDRVHKKAPKKVFDAETHIYGTSGIGADDVNGCWAILRVLEKCKNKNMELPSFVFSVREETCASTTLKNLLDYNSKVVKSMLYGIVIDRRGAGDIICESNDYGTVEFEDALVNVIGQRGFKPCMGSFSDADTISNWMSCANLSAGYHNPHTDFEYTDVGALNNTVSAVMAILKSVNKKYKKPEKYFRNSRYDGCTSGRYGIERYHSSGLAEAASGEWKEDAAGVTRWEERIKDEGESPEAYDAYCVECNTFLHTEDINFNGSDYPTCLMCGSDELIDPADAEYEPEKDDIEDEDCVTKGLLFAGPK